MTRALRLRRAARAEGQDGFTLIELSVAMFITLLVVASLTGAFIASLKGVALAKQRQAATALATATMEQFRAVDYGTLSAGMACSDLTTPADSRVTITGTCAGGGTATLNSGVSGIPAETLTVQAGTPAAAIAPIYPHLSTKTLDQVIYSTAAYVTNAATPQPAFNLTVLVSWSSAVSKGSQTIVQRSLEYSPSRCLSSATHPYAGACQSSFHGDAGQTKAGISVVNADDAKSTIPGFTGSGLDLTSPSLSTTLGAEQISKLTAAATTSAVVMDDLLGSTTTGGAAQGVAADTDPSSSSTGVGTGTVSQSGVSTLSLTGPAGSLTLNPSTSDSGSVDARASSTAASCLDAGALAIAGSLNRPCSWGTSQTAGTSSSLNINLSGGAPNWAIATVGTAPQAARATVARVGTAGGVACPTTTGAGCLTAQSSRSLGAILLGGLPVAKPGDAPPPGWNGWLINLTGVQESAYADGGAGRRPAPKFTRGGGALAYYDAVSGTVKTQDITTLTTDFAPALGTVSGTYTQGGQTIGISIAGTLRVGAAKPLPPDTTAPDALCKTAACDYSATPASTLTATLIYTITSNGLASTRFAVVVDLGAVLARSSYKAAFDA